MNSAEAREIGRIAQSLLKKSGDLAQKFHYHENQGVWYVDIGEYDLARSHFLKARQLTENSSSSDLDAVLDVNLGELELWCQNIATARKHFSQLESADMWPIQSGVQETVDAGLGLCALYSGEIGQARRYAESLPIRATEWYFDRTLSVLFLARLRQAEGRTSEAIEILNEGGKRAQGRFVPGWLRLQMEEVRLRKKKGGKGEEENALRIARTAIQTASELGLVNQIQKLQHIAPSGEIL